MSMLPIKKIFEVLKKPINVPNIKVNEVIYKTKDEISSFINNFLLEIKVYLNTINTLLQKPYIINSKFLNNLTLLFNFIQTNIFDLNNDKKIILLKLLKNLKLIIININILLYNIFLTSLDINILNFLINGIEIFKHLNNLILYLEGEQLIFISFQIIQKPQRILDTFGSIQTYIINLDDLFYDEKIRKITKEDINNKIKLLSEEISNFFSQSFNSKKSIEIFDKDYDYIYCNTPKRIKEFKTYLFISLTKYFNQIFELKILNILDNKKLEELLNNIETLFNNLLKNNIPTLKILIELINNISHLLYIKDDNKKYNILIDGIEINILLKKLIEYLENNRNIINYNKYENNPNKIYKFDTKDLLYGYIRNRDNSIDFYEKKYNEKQLQTYIDGNIYSFNINLFEPIEINIKTIIKISECKTKEDIKDFILNTINPLLKDYLLSIKKIITEETINNINLVIENIFNENYPTEVFKNYMMMFSCIIEVIYLYNIYLLKYSSKIQNKYNLIKNGMEIIILLFKIMNYLINGKMECDIYIDDDDSKILFNNNEEFLYYIEKNLDTDKNYKKFIEKINISEILFNLSKLSETEIVSNISKNIFNINKISKNLMDYIILYKRTGGAEKYKKTDNKITVIYKKKQYTRNIYISESKKYVKINKIFMLLSKLKKI
jgi:hypothetical protein